MRRWIATLPVAVLVMSFAPVSAQPGSDHLQPGFVVSTYVQTGGTPTSLAFGRDTRTDASGQRLYIADHAGGTVLAVDDLGGVGSSPTVFAEGFDGPLGVLAGRDGSVYVADSEAPREGPWGFRPYGRVWRVRDTDGDGTANKRNIVLKDLPNGRHNTNGMAWGPDGLLYITNGNSTDDGLEGGEAEVRPWSGSVVRVSPRARRVSLADLPVRRHLVATGWRNVYDLAFSPVNPTKLFVPMNGIDDAREGRTGENPADPALEDSDDLLYLTDIDDRKREHFGFPSCLYNEAEQGDLAPYDNPHPGVIEHFGVCDEDTVPRPVASFGLHTSSDGLAFQTTDRWQSDFKNDLFVAEWGSLFGPPAGHDVIRVELNDRGTKVVGQSVFLHADLPIDVTFDRAGVMYVADFSGAILRVDRAI